MMKSFRFTDSGRASVAESSVALPPVSVESRHAVSHALNPRHRMPAVSGQHAGPSFALFAATPCCHLRTIQNLERVWNSSSSSALPANRSKQREL